MVHEDTGELFAHGLGQQGGADGGVHAAGQGQQDLAIPHPLPDGLDGGLEVVLHGPVSHRAADPVEEVMEHVQAVLGVVHLGMVLDPVEPPGFVGDGHVGAGAAVGHQGEALGHLGHIVPVAHPGDALLRQALEKLAGGVVKGLGLSVLPGGVVLGGGDPAAQGMGHELASVADAQHRQAQLEEAGIHLGGAVLIDTVGPAGEDEADGRHGLELVQRGRVGLDFAVDAAFPDPAGDELVILSAEIQHDDGLMVHMLPPEEWIRSSISPFSK